MNQPQKEQELDGYQIALRLIAEEAERKTGFLDLGMLGLTELPDELFQLTHLTSLNLGSSHVVDDRWKEPEHDLGPNAIATSLVRLAELPLRSLFLYETDVTDLQPLANLQALQTLDCSRTQVADLQPLAKNPALQSLDCSWTQVTDLQPLANLQALHALSCSRTQVADLQPLANLQLIESLDCSATRVGDLRPLANLQALQSLDCSWTQVTDLGPLANLQALHAINCSDTQVTDLQPLANLQALHSLSCYGTQVSDLQPLANMQALHSLNCYETQVTDLEPLANVQALQTLICSRTQVTDLQPLANLQTLQSLSCSETRVIDLQPLAHLQALQSVNCSRNQISDLQPLAHLQTLQRLDCAGTQVTDLQPLSNLSKFQDLNAFDCTIESLDVDWIQHCGFTELYLGPQVSDLPAEVLSPNAHASCLETLRSHLSDLKDGSEPSRDVKLLVIGNGRVGKSQIARRLKGLQPEPDPDSTHGVAVMSTRLPLDGSEPMTPINLWDFGGQDVYHGTHALFMKCQAIFLIVWSSDAEDSREHEYRGMTFRNYPLPYWLTYVRYLGGQNSPVLVVQNKCESAAAEANSPPCSPADLAAFQSLRAIHYSAHLDRGRPAMDDAIAAAIEHLHTTHRVARVGTGRMTVRRELERLRDDDALLEPADRKHRTLSQTRFRQMCEEAGSISSPEAFLQYLHNCGTVFYREGLFDDQIILDQSWALDAIYSVLDRKNSLRQIRQLRGRFTRSLLESLVWNEFNAAEQQLLLSMMQSCGICFSNRPANERLQIGAEYIAPDLLPEREALAGEIAALWDHAAPQGELVFAYPFLHHALLRGLISQIGQLAQGTGVYWRYGLCGFESTTGCHLLIDHEREGDLAGRVIVQCKGHRHNELLTRLSKLIEQQNSLYGLNEVDVSGDVAPTADRMPAVRGEGEVRTEPDRELQFAASPVARDVKEYYISYAWGDDSPTGEQRAKAVDDLCEQARRRGVTILIDKEQTRVGDRISDFMQRIGQGKRVFVMLSDKYLKSPYCMCELFEIWRTSEEEPARFLQRVRVFKLPDAQISKLKDRLAYTEYWLKEFAETQKAVDRVGAVNLSGPSLQQWKAMRYFAEKTDTILTHLADVLKPKSINDLAEAMFDES